MTCRFNLAVFRITGGVPVTPIGRDGGLERHTGWVQVFSINAAVVSAEAPTGKPCVAAGLPVVVRF